jgi:hypothetical protein
MPVSIDKRDAHGNESKSYIAPSSHTQLPGPDGSLTGRQGLTPGVVPMSGRSSATFRPSSGQAKSFDIRTRTGDDIALLLHK